MHQDFERLREWAKRKENDEASGLRVGPLVLRLLDFADAARDDGHASGRACSTCDEFGDCGVCRAYDDLTEAGSNE